jgi:hypothetical protein
MAKPDVYQDKNFRSADNSPEAGGIFIDIALHHGCSTQSTGGLSHGQRPVENSQYTIHSSYPTTGIGSSRGRRRGVVCQRTWIRNDREILHAYQSELESIHSRPYGPTSVRNYREDFEDLLRWLARTHSRELGAPQS